MVLVLTVAPSRTIFACVSQDTGELIVANVFRTGIVLIKDKTLVVCQTNVCALIQLMTQTDYVRFIFNKGNKLEYLEKKIQWIGIITLEQIITYMIIKKLFNAVVNSM